MGGSLVKKDVIELKLTPSEIVKLIKEKTGKDVSVETHWFQVIMENTRELPPYSLVTFRANPR
jgi:type II secretory pathway component PulK